MIANDNLASGLGGEHGEDPPGNDITYAGSDYITCFGRRQELIV